MEAVIRDDVSGKSVLYEVSETAKAGGLLEEACTLFGREVLDSALEVDGAVVCTGVVEGVSGGEASVGSLGVHADSSLVLCRSRDRVLAVVAEWGKDSGPDRGSLPPWAWDDEVVALAAVAAQGAFLQYASASLREDKEVVMAAVASYGYSLKYASDSLKADKEVVTAAVMRHGFPLKYASDSLRADKEVVMAAVVRHGGSLQHASDNLRADKEVVMAAVTCYGRSLEYASDNLKADRDIMLAAAVQRRDAPSQLR